MSEPQSQSGPGSQAEEPDPAACAPDARAIDIHWQLECAEIDPPLSGWLEPRMRSLAALAGVRQAAVNIVGVDDARMSQLHEQYKGMTGPTDVLSFDMREPAGPIEGDIVVCLDEAARQASRRGIETRREVLLYALHGLLHLLGEDDRDPEAAARMHQREDELLEAAGVGAVYRAATPRASDTSAEQGQGGQP